MRSISDVSFDKVSTNPDGITGRSFQNFAYGPNSPKSTQVLLAVSQKDDGQYLFNQVNNSIKGEPDTLYYHKADEVIENLGLPRNIPKASDYALGPFNRVEADAILRIAPSVAIANHFSHTAKEEASFFNDRFSAPESAPVESVPTPVLNVPAPEKPRIVSAPAPQVLPSI